MILAIETAARTRERVALIGGEGNVLGVVGDEQHSVAAGLVPDILGLLEEGGVKGEELEAVAVDCGPGSFTGIRIGIATARGLGDGWGIPVWGVTQFDAFPRAGEGGARLLLIDAGYGRGVYYQLETGADVVRGFARMDELGEIKGIAQGNGIVLGWREGVRLDETRWRWAEEEVVIDAAAVGRAALRLRAEGKELAAEPVYLHTHAYAKSGAEGVR